MCNRYTLIDPDSAFAEIARSLGIPLKNAEMGDRPLQHRLDADLCNWQARQI